MRYLGITQTTTRPENYAAWFRSEDLGEAIRIVPLSYESFDWPILASLHGILLTGGVDIHPERYGENTDYPNQPAQFILERDHFEEIVYRYAKLMGIPMLAVCRGMQLIHVVEGGKLIQDLGPEGNARHRAGEADREHEIRVLEGSALHRITGQTSGMVNSAHHQAIDPQTLGGDLQAVAWAPDGTVEALTYREQVSRGYLMAVEYHPERMSASCSPTFFENLKLDFLTALRKYQAPTMDIHNPANGQLLASLHADTGQTLQEKYRILREGQLAWAAVPLTERTAILHAFADGMEKNREHLAAILTSEVGKPLQQSRNELAGAISRVQWMVRHAATYLAEEIMHQEPGLTELIRYEPLGVIANISAWNYPYLVGVNVFVPALLAGNTVGYKPSEYAALTALEIKKLLLQAGVPDTAFQVMLGAGDVGEQLLDLPLDGYFFTGSHKTGQYIYRRVASRMVPCHCELGGKDPIYIADDVIDLASVAAATADGAFYNNGQSCCAVERIYVHQAIYDAYVEAFVQEVRSWKMGDPTAEGVYLGPVTRESHPDWLAGQIRDALEKGARLACGGKHFEGPGNFFEPTVLVDVHHGMAVMREETFGPLIGIMRVQDDMEALALMADTDYGLTAGVYTRDRDRAEYLLSQLNTGTGYWNCCDRVSPALPWSGRQHSGIGATLSHAGLRAFVRPKAYHLKG